MATEFTDQELERRLREAYDDLYGSEQARPPRGDLIASALDQALDDVAPSTGSAATGSAATGSAASASRRGGKVVWWAIPLAAAAAVLVALWLPSRFDSSSSAQLASAYGGARVEQLEPSLLVWQESTRTLVIHEGAVRVAVDPSKQQEYHVRTDRFVVDVTGTVFEVTEDEVRVLEGTVRLKSPTGQVLKAALTAGEKWQPDARASEEAAAEEPEEQTRSARAPVESDSTAPDVGVLLDEAAELIRQGEAKTARERLQRVLGGRPTAAERARAEVLLADVAQLQGRRAQAESLYEKSSTSKDDAQQAEAALFSAARLAAERGNHDKARQLFRQYLERYPGGRLQREVIRRLRQLEQDGMQ